MTQGGDSLKYQGMPNKSWQKIMAVILIVAEIFGRNFNRGRIFTEHC